MNASDVIDYADKLGSRAPQALKPVLRRTRDLMRGWWPAPVADWRLARVSTSPETFTEKIRYRVAYDRRPHLTLFADKAGVRDYVTERVGAAHLTQTYGIYDRVQDIEWTTFPREFACKATHGSGAVVVVADSASESARLPASARFVDWDRFHVRPEHAPTSRLERLAAKWLTMNYHYGSGRLPEWAYRDIPPRVLVEELLQTSEGQVPPDWKFFTFDGHVRFATIELDRFSDHRREVLHRDGSRMPIRIAYDQPDEATEIPANFAELVAVAEELGRGVDFVRVDLYSLGDRIIVGELTNYPSAGNQAIPDDFNLLAGSWWNLVT